MKSADGTNTINTGAGADKIKTGNGNDLIDAGDDADQIKSGGGNDIIDAGAGADRLDGGPGNDMLTAGADNDRLLGGPGDDLLDAGTGTNTLEGGPGADLLLGSGSDVLIGGPGSDLFSGGSRSVGFRRGSDFGSDEDVVADILVGDYRDPRLSGIRTDQLPNAPDIDFRDHQAGVIDYSTYSNPPSYGPHHAFVPGVVPIPTGEYGVEQDDGDLVHNLEHGHVWIAYDPALITASDLQKLQLIVQTLGGGHGVVLVPRTANDDAIALVSWGRLLTLNSFDQGQVLTFIGTNRGHAPEGFITP